MRLAQLAKDNPWQKKKTDTAIRTCDLVKEVVIDEAMVILNIIVKINQPLRVLATEIIFYHLSILNGRLWVFIRKPASHCSIQITYNYILGPPGNIPK